MRQYSTHFMRFLATPGRVGGKNLLKPGMMMALMVALAAGSFALADETGAGLAGWWLTAKNALLECGEDSCVMRRPSPEEPDGPPLGAVVLKDYAANARGLGTAKLVHPRRYDRYLDVETHLAGDRLTLTLRLLGRSTSATWTRTAAPASDAPADRPSN